MISLTPKHSWNSARGSDILILYALDKRYDSEEIHRLIRYTLNACSFISVRDRKRKKISGYDRIRIALSFDREKYDQGNKVETIFFILKRESGESPKVRKSRLQIREIKIKE